MMRSIVFAALFVCSVPKTSVPRSAAESAMAIVSRSRISPTRITSGIFASRRFQRLGERLRVRCRSRADA